MDYINAIKNFPPLRRASRRVSRRFSWFLHDVFPDLLVILGSVSVIVAIWDFFFFD